MKGYLVFAGLMLLFLIVFFLLWKNRKSKNADVNHDPWEDFTKGPFDLP